jgi:hypothetical protein
MNTITLACIFVLERRRRTAPPYNKKIKRRENCKNPLASLGCFQIPTYNFYSVKLPPTN